MCWGSISTKGELAKVLSTALGRDIDELDGMDDFKKNGNKNGEIHPYSLAMSGEQEVKDRFYINSPMCSYGASELVVVDNGNGKIDGDDVVIVQLWKDGTHVWVGGTFSNLLNGYEKSNGERVAKVLPEAAMAKSLFAKIQEKKITLFADFKKQAPGIIEEVFSE